MRSALMTVSMLALLGTTPVPTFADEPLPADPMGMWECPQAGDVPLYTNRERPGCRKMELKPLSTVPSPTDLPALRQQPTLMVPEIERPGVVLPPSSTHSRNVPDWAKGWYASNTTDASVQTDVCALYSEWLQLIQRTQGGFWFGSSSSYGSDPSGRNYDSRGDSMWDNRRYLALTRIFGAGFVPIGCM